MKDSLNSEATLKFREVWLFLWRRLGSNRMLFMLALVLSLSQTLIMMMFPLFSELYFNQLELEQFAYVKLLIVIGTAFALVMTLIALIGEYMKQTAITRLKRDLTTDMADHAQRLPLERTQVSHSSDLVQRVTHDTGRTTGLLPLVMENMGNQGAMFLLAAIYMLWLNWQFALVVLAISPLVILGSHLLRRRLRTVGQETAEQEALVRQYLQDTMQGMETIQAFGVSDWMRDRFVQQKEILNLLYMKRMWWQQIAAAVSRLITSFLVFFMVLLIGWWAIQGSMALGAIMAFFILIWRVVSPLQNLGSLWGQLQEGLGAAFRVITLWHAEKEPGAFTDQTADEASQLILRDVSFGYRNQTVLKGKDPTTKQSAEEDGDLINNVNLQISPGMFVAVVGPSGSGKSTVAKLAAGMLFPSKGSVSIGGLDPLENPEQARRMIAYVPQSPFLFSGTIRENLQMVLPDAQEETLENVICLARANEFIDTFSKGLDTLIGEQGDSLSGGQRQRLAIARALLVDRPIFVFDEATSALDQDTESKVMESIRKEVKEQGKMLLMIAHRLTTVKDADLIIVMEKGFVKEQGTHQELMQSDIGLYRRLWGESSHLTYQGPQRLAKK